MMYFWQFLCLLLLHIPLVVSLEHSPWFDRDFALYVRPTFLYQYYPKFNSTSSSYFHNRSGQDQFFTLSGSLTAFGISGELEFDFANTRKQKACLDSVRLNARYQLLSDLAAVDPLSLVLGATYIQAFGQSVNDPSSFHHGKCEVELYLSAGNEFPYKQFWETHTWGMVAFGVADKGSAWMRLDLAVEKNWFDQHKIQASIHTLVGFGQESLKLPPTHFHGYGPIKHRSVDLELRYSWATECYGRFDLGYTYRVYASNFPANTQVALLGWESEHSVIDFIALFK